ncbi:hypothetical protein PQJ75_01275 [Rhodoplanes sp. TEM]|uniref:Sulfur globule protein n=1 Tax=Rhodoplanes tepidamans TaxID=200616 RepID=A0ABT5J9N1_RHOTP|nr:MULTISPECIES: hypothetical protein [Rhodoplanes]MDC7786278.1 hypothetical protein [Rhodoplanes tepidamans]MDC7982351.1 hypothetical protein [Rhodoplanes sp. TEM]MDQ0355077.1 hypothetical protein [Rhodoplanes tepidamans]
MSIKTKLAAVALAAVTVAGGIAAGTGEAAAKPKFGPAVGFGLVAGTAIGLAAASSAYGHPYGYYGYGPGPGCRWVPVHNAFGQYIGSKKYCGW